MKHAVKLCLTLALFAIAAQANPSLAIGQPAPDFALKDLNGAKHALKDARGQITVVAFLSTKCPISNAYNERLRALYADFSKQNVAFFAINASADENAAEIKAHAEKQGFAFTILKDKGNKVADAYHAERTPEMFVVDAQGVLRYHGRIDNSQVPIHVKRSDLREALNELLAGKSVSVPEAKALGCMIKREQSAQLPVTQSGGRSALSAPFITAFAPQKRTATAAKKPAPKPSGPQTKSAATKAAASALPANLALLKPAEFPKLRESFKGKVLVVNFWATWCAPCVAEMPEFVRLDQLNHDKGVQVIAISADEVDDLKTLVANFIKEKQMTFPVYVMDTDDPQAMIEQLSEDWPGTLPATFVFDKTGKLTFSRFGIINREALVSAVEAALK